MLNWISTILAVIGVLIIGTSGLESWWSVGGAALVGLGLAVSRQDGINLVSEGDDQQVTFDPLVEERVTPHVVVTRSDRGNPMIVPRGGTVPIEYTRASGLADMLTVEGYQLSQWRTRYKLQGVARYPDLAARAAAVYYSTGPVSGTMPISARQAAAKELDAVGEEAAERMGINEAANIGTAGHSLTEPANQGQVHPLLVDTVAGYNEVTSAFTRIASEVFVVNDALRVAGTFDSAYLSREFPGQVVIGDTKTGKNYHQAEFEIQLAQYAHGEVYLGDPIDGVDQRLTFEEYFGLPVNVNWAYLVHVSVTGKPKPRVVMLDLERGWRRAQLAAAVRDERIAIDQTGIGAKVDHRGLAVDELNDLLAALVARTDESRSDYLSAEQFREKALQLRERFLHVWTDYHTKTVKMRLA